MHKSVMSGYITKTMVCVFFNLLFTDFTSVQLFYFFQMIGVAASLCLPFNGIRCADRVLGQQKQDIPVMHCTQIILPY